MGKPKTKKGKGSIKKSQQKNIGKVNKKKAVKHKWKDAREKKLKGKGRIPEEREGDEVEVTPPEGLSRNRTTSSDDDKGKDVHKKESLRERMMKRLEAARFRQINEELDSKKVNDDPHAAFQSDPELFRKYHEAYRERVEHWPKNPLDVIIKWIKKKMKGDKVIADFGCGEARLSASVPNKVHSFDLYALNNNVTACDMSNVPLEDGTVDAAIFCLSLMGTDVSKFIAEANRVLKINGIMKIAEVSSRFIGRTHENFLKRIKKFGFIVTQSGTNQHHQLGDGDASDDVFLMLDFKKTKSLNKGMISRLPALKLNPSVYKKR